MVNFLTSSLLIFLLGMKKMIVNHLEKIFVTSDAATIMTEVLSFKSFFNTLLDRSLTSSSKNDGHGFQNAGK